MKSHSFLGPPTRKYREFVSQANALCLERAFPANRLGRPPERQQSAGRTLSLATVEGACIHGVQHAWKR
jgi:hypothetical protein